MSNTVRIRLFNIPEHCEPGDAIECTIEGKSHECEFVEYGSHPRIIQVRIFGFRNAEAGRLSTQRNMFEPLACVEWFTVNHAPGRDWHRTAGLVVEVR